jgi:serine/threonine-protein kinase
VEASDHLVGTILDGRYQIQKRLGEGAMGRVYLAQHVNMERQTAIKISLPQAEDDPGETLARFRREAANASRIDHPNVATIYDFGVTAEGMAYLAMEFIPGETLADVIDRGKTPLKRVADIVEQIADGLTAAHALGVLHRDLKPQNIMIRQMPDGFGRVKLVDFGLAKRPDVGSQGITQTGLRLGTPLFMSPEQWAGEPLDGRSDVYSLVRMKRPARGRGNVG